MHMLLPALHVYHFHGPNKITLFLWLSVCLSDDPKRSRAVRNMIDAQPLNRPSEERAPVMWGNLPGLKGVRSSSSICSVLKFPNNRI